MLIKKQGEGCRKMIIIFFLLWLLLNGHVGADAAFLEIVLFGAGVSVLAFFFMTRFTRWDKKLDRFVLRHFPMFLLYEIVLFWNVVISNLKVLQTILSPKGTPEPAIVRLEIPIRNEMLRTILANSITLTPGTITISQTQTCFIVHCLKKEYIDGFENSSLVKILSKMEAAK